MPSRSNDNAHNTQPASPKSQESGIRSHEDSHRGHSRSSSLQSSEATPTPSASALRRAQALVAGDNIPFGSGSKFSSLLHTLQPSSRSNSAHAQPVSRAHSRSDSAYQNSNSGHHHHHSSGSQSFSSLSVLSRPHTSPQKMGSTPLLPSSSSIRPAYSGAVNIATLNIGALNMATYPSSTSLVPSGSSITTVGPNDKDNAWGALHVHVLPLFNREPLRVPIEDLNALVKKHMAAVVARNPGKAISQLESDVSDLIFAGMLTLNSKLAMGVDDEKISGRVVELWGFFWDQVLPYLEGVFLPLQIDPYLISLAKTPKAIRAPSPSVGDGTISNANLGPHTIDIRKLALTAFRDSVVHPIAPRLHVRLTSPRREPTPELTEHQAPRLEQMLLVLSSIATNTTSLTTDSSSQSPAERSITSLLRLVLYPHGNHSAGATSGPVTRLPSFLSGGPPRDRRGRVARKSLHVKIQQMLDNSDDGGALGLREDERERERVLEALKSPDIDDVGTDETVTETLGNGPGGWGMGDGRRAAIYDVGFGEDDDDGFTSVIVSAAGNP